MHESTRSRLAWRVCMPAIATLTVMLLSACGSAPVAPTESLAAARDAIANAEQSDARQFSGAELDEARHQLEQAEAAVSAENMIEADRHAKQSRVVAELASERAATAKATEINRQMGRDAEALREEMKRTGDQQ